MQPSLGKTGTAKIDKVGHTTNGRNGSDAGKRIVSEAPARDQEIKSTK